MSRVQGFSVSVRAEGEEIRVTPIEHHTGEKQRALSTSHSFPGEFDFGGFRDNKCTCACTFVRAFINHFFGGSHGAGILQQGGSDLVTKCISLLLLSFLLQ